jgi:hypothetical protein
MTLQTSVRPISSGRPVRKPTLSGSGVAHGRRDKRYKYRKARAIGNPHKQI